MTVDKALAFISHAVLQRMNGAQMQYLLVRAEAGDQEAKYTLKGELSALEFVASVMDILKKQD